MKLYVIKDSEGRYLSDTLDFVEGFYNADVFDDFQLAMCYWPSDCEINEWCILELKKNKDIQV